MTLQEFLSDFVFFDFDQAVLRPDAISVLQIKARWLKDHTDPKTFIIEGHCDERGTEAYNIALGERRAQAVKHYLVDSGLDANRFQIYSYGEERPLEAGHDESAWSQNRRVAFAINQ